MEVISAIIIVICIGFALWLFVEFPSLIIVALIFGVLIKSCGITTIEDAVESIDEAVEELVQTETVESSEPSVVEDSVNRRCLDGIMYLLVVENGQSFMAPKEDTFGYNVKCSE